MLRHAVTSITISGLLGTLRASASFTCSSLKSAVHRAVLASAPQDADALAVKLFSLISSGRHADALSFIDSNTTLAPRSLFERAYCTWKAGQTEAALQLLQDANSEAEQHLKALLLTRTGEHASAHELYTKLIKSAKGNKQAVVELVCSRFIPTLYTHNESHRCA